MTDARATKYERWWNFLFVVVVIGDVAAGLVLRFRTTSKLWLDEAQSVNIAAHPLSQLTHYLRNDGAPPLYYVLLHFWMGFFGRSDFDVRALSGVISVLGLIVAYFALRAWWGTRIALIGTAVLAVLPYAVYFGTETRMYSLIMLLSTLLLWLLRIHVDHPRWQSAFGIMIVGALLLYTQYWAIYLLGVVGIYALWRWWSHRATSARAESLLAFALAGSFVLWLPWFPIFNEQRLHTGTPWSPAPTLDQLFTWFDNFTVNQNVHVVVASLHTEVTMLAFLTCVAIGVFCARMLPRTTHIDFNFLGNAPARVMAFIVLGTMFVGMVASHFDGAAYAPRYAAVVAVPITFLAARGIWNLGTPLRILIVLGLVSGACLWTDKWGIGVQRTQAGEIAAALATVPSNSIVIVCPDQLGPSLLRYSNPALTYVGYPRLTNPAIVNWYDYLAQYDKHSTAYNAQVEASVISKTQPVYVVRASGYGLKLTCLNFATHLASDLGRVSVSIVKQYESGFYQPMGLQELVPATK